MTSRTKQRLALGLCLAVSSTALAADTPDAVIEQGDARYAAFVRDGRAVVVATPVAAELSRDASQQPPACDDVDTRLAPLAPEIERCKDPGESGSESCTTIRSLVDGVRFAGDTLGVTALAQGWAAAAQLAVPADAEALGAETARVTGVDAAAVHVATSVEAVGLPGPAVVVVQPSGNSWASRLLGFSDLDDPGLSHDAGAGRWVTRDHVLACGLLAGEVSAAWDRPVEIDLGGAAPGALTGDQLWAVYRRLGDDPGADADQAAHGVAVGLAVARALEPESPADPRAAVRAVLDGFYSGAALEFRADLPEADVRALAAPVDGVTVDLNLPWVGAVAP